MSTLVAGPVVDSAHTGAAALSGADFDPAWRGALGTRIFTSIEAISEALRDRATRLRRDVIEPPADTYQGVGDGRRRIGGTHKAVVDAFHEIEGHIDPCLPQPRGEGEIVVAKDVVGSGDNENWRQT